MATSEAVGRATDGDLLLRAICENPADDTPRLVYADLLDENGQPERAEFIRVQVRLAGRFRGCDPVCNQETGHGRHCEHDLRDELRRRERDLWPGAVFHLLDVLRPTKAIPDEMVIHLLADRPTDRVPRKPEAYTSRGFVSHVTCTAADWLTHADELAWVPGATKECRRCNATRPGIHTQWDCTFCRNTGRVPREFRGTEQPIERVTLTTMPGNTIAFGLRERTEWPGIVFELSAAKSTSPTVDWAAVPGSPIDPPIIFYTSSTPPA